MSARPLASLRERLPDVSGQLGSAWDRLPGWSRWVVYALLVAFVVVVVPRPEIGQFMTPASDWNRVLFHPIGTYILLAIGLNIVVGQAGLLDLGYVAFFAIGGYSMGVLGAYYGIDFWIILPVAALITAFSGILLGSPTLRLRGDYLAIVTLGFGEIIQIVGRNTDYVGGPTGIPGIPHPPSIPGVVEFGVLDIRPYYYLLVFFVILAIVLHRRLENSRVGRAWMAIREDEDAAELTGVPIFRFKLWAFALGGVVGGSSGVIYAAQVISISPRNFEFILSALILCAVVLGGSGNILGVIVGAFLIAWLPERFREFAEWRILIFGAALVLMMALRPEGLFPSRRRRAELAEGEGGMGGLGAEIAGPTAVRPVDAEEPVTAGVGGDGDAAQSGDEPPGGGGSSGGSSGGPRGEA